MTPISIKHPLWALGFRPLYFVAACWFVVSLFIWLSAYAHGMPIASHLPPMEWHAHEMLFGFAGAVIVGFLFTAVRNWTAQNTPRGIELQVIVLLWLLTRIFNLSGASWWALASEALFFIAAAIGIGRPLVRSSNKRNYIFVVALCFLSLVSSLHHLTALQVIHLFSGAALMQAALGAIVIVVTVMAGRVVPMFTKNPLPHVTTRHFAWLEKTIIPVTVAWLLAELLSVEWMRFVLAGALAVLHAIRFSGWGWRHTAKIPMLWILHAAYAWLIIGFALRFSGFFSPMAQLLSTHSLTAGTISGLCLGMMSRTARGHTGRLIHASKTEAVAFGLILTAAFVRVLLPLLWPAFYQWFVAIAGVLAMSAFVCYVVVFAPWLFRPRADGRPD